MKVSPLAGTPGRDRVDHRQGRNRGRPAVGRDRAPGNQAPIGGIKVVTASGWFAARPSGTEDIYKIYGESFRGQEHLGVLLGEAQRLVDRALGDAKA